MKPLITALIDTYNHERYIEHALTSVLDQGLSPTELEIVVVDDGSTDRTPEIVKKFAKRISHVRKKNGGQASAFNAGFAASHADIIATLDGDDWWARGKLASVLDVLEANPDVAAVSHGYYEFHEDKQKTELRIPTCGRFLNIETVPAIHEANKAWPYLLPSTLVLRRKVMQWIMPIPEQMVFMADSALQCAAMVHGILVLKEPLAYYRYHEQNLYAGNAKNLDQLRRRSEMAELVYDQLYRKLVSLGVQCENVKELLYPSWTAAKRFSLSTFGGSRLKAFRTEMEAFHTECKKPGLGYRLFKYAVVGTATLALPPRWFYRMRNIYAEQKLGPLRDRFLKA